MPWKSASTLVASLAVLVASTACASSDATKRIDAESLSRWETWGIGTSQLRESDGYLELREGEGSLGINLVSADTLPRDLRVNLRVRPLSSDGVVVVLLSAAPLQGGVLEPPDGYRGEQSLWKDQEIGSFAFAFHTAFHQPNAFVAINPGWRRLAEVADPAAEDRWYDVEVGRQDRRLWLSIDGSPVLDATAPDQPTLGAGRLVLRLRGPGDGSFALAVDSVDVTSLEGDAPN